MSQTKTVRFIIHGMHCTSCAMNIDLDLEEVPGIVAVSTSYAKQVCTVEYDSSKVSLEQIRECIGKSGYAVSPIV